MQETCVITITNITNTQNKDEEEKRKQLFKQMLTGLNDLDESVKKSKQVNIHRM